MKYYYVLMKKTKISLIFFSLLLLVALTSTQAAVHLKPKSITTPADVSSYVVGSTGNNLIWQYEAEEGADLPGTYTVTIDSTPLTGHIDVDWEDKVDIVVNIDGLSVGDHTVVISVTDHDLDDMPALTATDTVTVTVTDVSDTSSGETNTSSSSSPSSTTNTLESSTESDSSVLFIPVIGMLLAIGIGVPILKYKDFKQ